MLEFLVLTNPFVWVPLLIILFMVEGALVGSKSYGWAIVTLIVVLFGLQFLSDVKPFTWMYNNPLKFIGIIALYLVGSIIYGYIKWMSYVHQKIDAIDDKIAEYMVENQSTLNGTDKVKADKKRGEIMQRAQDNILGSGERLPIQVARNKARLAGWMAFWPVSALYTLFDDPLRRFFTAVIRRMSGTLQRVSDRASAKLDAKYRVGE